MTSCNRLPVLRQRHCYITYYRPSPARPRPTSTTCDFPSVSPKTPATNTWPYQPPSTCVGLSVAPIFAATGCHAENGLYVINSMLTRSMPMLTAYKQLVDGPDSRPKWGLERVVLVPRANGGVDPAEDERDGVNAVLEVVDRPLEGARGLGCCQRVVEQRVLQRVAGSSAAIWL